MEVYVARQPILDINRKVVYYELLFRSNQDNYYVALDGDKATLEVITNSFTLIGMGSLTNGKKAFINFTESLLLQETALLLPKDKVVIEILETVTPSDEIVECCRKLKALGYALALDDFVFKPGYEALIDIVDFIKIDFVATKGIERKAIIDRFKNKNIKFLAEKVETIEDFNEAVGLGYTYFQGYFFSNPTILSAKEIPSNSLYNFDLIKLMKEDSYDIINIANAIKKDVSLSYKLLKYINSASIGLKTEIHSIRQALVLMGKKEFMKWASLVTIRSFNDKNSEAIMDISILRALIGEAIASKVSMASRASEVFIMEMFSNIDVLLNQPMEKILQDLPIAEDIKAALLGEENIFRSISELILCYEKADWKNFSSFSKRLGLREEEIPPIYANAVIDAANIIGN